MIKIIDLGIQKSDISKVIQYGMVLVGLALLGLVSGIMSGIFGARASAGFAANLRAAMFINIQKFSFSNIDKYSSSGLITRLTTDVSNIQNSYQMVIRMMMRAPALMFFSMIMAIIISPKLSVIFVVSLIALSIVLGLVIKKAGKAFGEVFRKYDALNSNIQENIRGIRVVKSFVQEDKEISKFEKSIGVIYDLAVKAENYVAKINPAMYLCIFAAIIALSYFGARLIVNNELSTGELTSLFTYIMTMLTSLLFLSFISVMVAMSEASARRIAEIIEESPDIVSKEDAIKEVKDGNIDFEHVYFSYAKGKGKPVLEDIDLHIRSGETIGIIGGTGSAKSTLISLISRLYDVTEGDIKVGGIDVRDYDIEELRNKVSVVLQKNVLFSGTILDNLRWGKEDASLEECIEVCKIACADEFINGFENGYETWIEQGGSNLSGGQRQRLCIARALLKSPKILILDDSTSAVDTATDEKIRQGFKNNLKTCTKIIIAQRISSVKDADRIIVLKDGRVDAFDTHDNLIKNNDIYADIVNIQLESSADFDNAEVRNE
jgi:ABC transporter related protein